MRNFLRLLLLIVGLVVIGCLSVRREEVRYSQFSNDVVVSKEMGLWIDSRFSDLELREIRRGVDQWNMVLNGNMKIVVLGRHDMEMELVSRVSSSMSERMVMKVSPENAIVPFMDKFGQLTITIAWCDRISGHYMYFVDGRVGLEDMHHVFLHEMGHMLGLGHMDGKLMHPSYTKSRYLCIDKESAFEVARVHGFNLATMNYCLRGS